jgi:hypothetical protein
VLKDPVAVPSGARLRVTLLFGHFDSGGGALYIQRARFAASDTDQFTLLANNAELSKRKQELASLEKQRAAMPGTTVPVITEQPARLARRTFTFARGNWLDKAAEVQPGTPAVLPPMPASAKADRLAMARWLVAPENPLTARVMVNRLWQELFGLGLVETAEDFGSSGTSPSHPELLDYLALRLQRDHAWSLKRMLRELVLSATYRQDATVSPEKLAADSRNRLFARGPRTRLTAEMVRDQALAISGLLAEKMYGPPVMPPQPDGVWQSVYNSQEWKTAEGVDRRRRAIYTYYKRTSGYPSLLTFDAPSRDICVARRTATNTPLQALVTLNDQAFVEFAQGFAERMEAAATDVKEQLASGYEIATGTAPQSAQLASLQSLYDDAAAVFDANPDAAKKLATTRQRYALTIVANALMNLDEVLTK